MDNQRTKTKSVLSQLHALEEEIIQLHGLVKALQQIQSDDSGSICVALAIEEKLIDFQHEFYKHWKTIIDEPR